MFRKMFAKLTKEKKETEKVEEPKNLGFFSTEDNIFKYKDKSDNEKIDAAFDMSYQQPPTLQAVAPDYSGTMDSNSLSPKLNQQATTTMPPNQFLWYASHGFIGFQACAIIAQHWLIAKACSMPAEDAVRNWFEITINDGEEVKPEVIDAMVQLDKDFKLNKNLREYITRGKMFGLRVAYFVVESDDPQYYEKPFNLDAITPGSYKGISQIDPYWFVGETSYESTGDPSAIDFYEPTWWRVGSKRIHKSHCCIYRNDELPDVLKPTYYWGSVSVPQQMAERVYAAERMSNEGPLLTMTKRTNIYKTDISQALANGVNFGNKIQQMVDNRDNYGVKIIDKDSEDMTQLDTTLGGVDDLIMTQYQISSSIAKVPATKLLGTTPKGFNSTGESEEASYHEELSSLQTNRLEEMVCKHHEIIIRSEIMPKFNIKEFNSTIKWNALDEMTAKEKADVNLIKSQTDVNLAQVGAIDGQDVRERAIADKESGYNGIETEAPEQEEDLFQDYDGLENYGDIQQKEAEEG